MDPIDAARDLKVVDVWQEKPVQRYKWNAGMGEEDYRPREGGVYDGTVQSAAANCVRCTAHCGYFHIEGGLALFTRARELAVKAGWENIGPKIWMCPACVYARVRYALLLVETTLGVDEAMDAMKNWARQKPDKEKQIDEWEHYMGWMSCQQDPVAEVWQ